MMFCALTSLEEEHMTSPDEISSSNPGGGTGSGCNEKDGGLSDCYRKKSVEIHSDQT